MGRTVIALVVAVVFAAPATAFTPQTRDAPWRLTGISRDGRALHLLYEGGGCLVADGAAVVDASVADRVGITVRQTANVPDEDEACTQEIGFLPLDVVLDAPLAGRRVVGGPRFDATFPARRMPRVVGLRRVDAERALAGQGLRARVIGRRSGVVHDQVPEPGRPLPKGKVVLLTGPFDPRARLRVTVAPQRVESVLEHGFRYAYRVDPAVEQALDADLSCDGKDAGTANLPTRGAHGTARVAISSVPARRKLRRRATTTCRLIVRSYPRDLRTPDDWLVLRTTTVTLRHR